MTIIDTDPRRCKGTLLFSPIPPVPLPSSSFLSLFLHPTDSYIHPFCSLLFPFLSTPFLPTSFAAEPRPVTPKSSHTSDSLGLARTRSDSSIHFGARPGYFYPLSPLHYSLPLLPQVAGTTPVHSPSTSLSHAPSYLVIFVWTCGWCTVQLSFHSSHATTVYTSLPSMENPYPVLFGFSLC